MSLRAEVPVLTLDGPTASGKGTVASLVAAKLGWHLLDSGAIYRLAALSVLNAGVETTDLDRIETIASAMQVEFQGSTVRLAGVDVTQAIRHERVGNLASELAKHARLRDVLLDRQRAFRCAPGLVADGRDMGTVVFPDAPVKIYLLANAQARAQRRYRQLQETNPSIDFETILQDLQARDARDMNRAVAPLRPAEDAFVLDSSELTIEQTVQAVLGQWYQYVQRHG